MAARRKSSAPCPFEHGAAERAMVEGEEAAWHRARAAGAPEVVVYDRIRDRERSLCANRRWMTEEEEGEDEEEEEDDDDDEGPEGYHCQICGYHTDQLQPFNVHLHSAHPAVVLQELYGLLGLVGGPVPGLGLPGGPVPGLGLPGGPVPGLDYGEDRKGEMGKPDIVQIDLTSEDEAGEQDPSQEKEEVGLGPIPTLEPTVASSTCSVKQPRPPADPAAPRELGPGLELDADGPLAEAFSRFPYPSPAELARCGLSAGLPAERVRVWFMVQRLRHGISWTPEEVREARDKLWHRPGTLRLPVPPPLTLLADQPLHPLVPIPAPGPTESQTNGDLASRSPGGAGREARKQVSGPKGEGGLLPGSPKKAHTSPDGADSPEARSCPPRALLLPSERRWRKTKGQLAALKSSFARDRYPDEAEMRRLQARTGLGKSEIKRWFSDSRYQLRNLPASYFQLRHGGSPAWQRNGRPSPQPEDEAEAGRGWRLPETAGDVLRRFGETSPASQREAEEGDLNQRKAEVGGVEEGEEKATSLPGVSDTAETAAHCTTGSSIATETPAYRTQASGQAPAPSPGRPRKTKEQLAILKTFFLRSQWPSGDDYTRLVEQTSLARADIIQWFGDTRYALKNGQLKWVHRSPMAFAAGPGTEPGPGPRTDWGPLEEYLSRHGRLRQDDLYRLCVETRMSAQQVAEWFRKRARPLELEVVLSEEGGSEEDRPAEESGGSSEREPDHGGHVVRVTL